MLMTPTLDKLTALNLTGMARALHEQMEGSEYQALSFDERLGLLVDRETQDRSNRRLERNLKTAKLRNIACIEDIDFRKPRGLERGLILGLADASWVKGHQNLLVTGPTGVGKTFVACALAQAAVRNGHTALYQRAPRLLDDLSIAHGDGRWARVMTALARVDVLLIDDVAIRPLTADQASDLLEVIEDRALRRATIVTSQLPVAEWHPSLGEPTVADAILDRLTHNARRIEMRGESLRRSDVESPSPAPEPGSRSEAASHHDAVTDSAAG